MVKYRAIENAQSWGLIPEQEGMAR
jgi:hypothetical protein